MGSGGVQYVLGVHDLAPHVGESELDGVVLKVRRLAILSDPLQFLLWHGESSPQTPLYSLLPYRPI